MILLNFLCMLYQDQPALDDGKTGIAADKR